MRAIRVGENDYFWDVMFEIYQTAAEVKGSGKSE